MMGRPVDVQLLGNELPGSLEFQNLLEPKIRVPNEGNAGQLSKDITNTLDDLSRRTGGDRMMNDFLPVNLVARTPSSIR